MKQDTVFRHENCIVMEGIFTAMCGQCSCCRQKDEIEFWVYFVAKLSFDRQYWCKMNVWDTAAKKFGSLSNKFHAYSVRLATVCNANSQYRALGRKMTGGLPVTIQCLYRHNPLSRRFDQLYGLREGAKIVVVMDVMLRTVSTLMHYYVCWRRSIVRTPFVHQRPIGEVIVKSFKFKIGVLWATIAQKQQISGDFI
jgi:hypothetical protein